MSKEKRAAIVVNKDNLELLGTPKVQKQIQAVKKRSAAILKKIIMDIKVDWVKEKDRQFNV